MSSLNVNIKQDEVDTLLEFSFAFWALDWVFQFTHFDSAEKADTDSTMRAEPVCTGYPLAT
jgi:hypothetical protein